MFKPARWINAVSNEAFLIASELAGLLDVMRVQRQVRKRQLIVTFTLPHFAHAFTFLLLAASLLGIFSVMGPVMSPVRLTASMAATTAVPAVVEAVQKHPVALSHSAPVQLRVPDAGIDTSLIKLGKNPDGTLATPERYDIAGWYEFAPTPGEIGPAVIVGHVDNYLGPAVFFRLKDLQVGQSVFVTRQDNKTVEFRVDSVELFDQQNFPTAAVYGNIDYAGLRLITCGGSFNPLTGHYSHNTVVYARQVPS